MRVLVTRPQHEAERTAERLRALGHAPLVAPLLTIAPTGEAPPEGAFDALLVTSANAVPMLASCGERLQGVPVFAVGEHTASCLREAGFTNLAVGEGDAAALARLVLERVPPGAHLLHAAGRDRRPELATALAATHHLTVWTAYEAVAAAALPEPLAEALRQGSLDAALHYSPRSAALLVTLVRASGLVEALLHLPHLCLSANVAAPLRQAGGRRVFVAARPDEASLLALLENGA